MDKNKAGSLYNIAAAVIAVILTVMIVCLSAGKNQFHMDEMWSFGLANSYGRTLFFPTMFGVDEFEEGMNLLENEDYKNFYDHWHPGSFFGNYVTVQKGERFTYGNVWHNQALDTSPPLYYALIHTICSFFPDSFSKWYGLIPNIIFYALSLWIFWLIAVQMFSDRIKALAALMIYGLSKAAISDAVFIRMYMLMTFLVLLLVWLFIRILGTSEKKYIFAAMAVSIAGFLTQYYFYIIAFILTLFCCIILLIRKDIRRAFLTGICQLGAVLAAIAIFPAVIDHVFHGPFTGHTSSSLRYMQSPLLVLKAPDGFFFMDDSMLVFAVILFILAVAALATAVLPSHRLQAVLGGRKPEIRKLPRAIRSAASDNRKAAAILVTVTFLLCFYLISSLAPMHNTYARRYLFPVMPLLTFIIIGISDLLTRFVVKLFTDNKKALRPASAVIFLFLAAAAAWNSMDSNPFLSDGDHGRYDLHSAVSGRKVLLICDDTILPHALSYDFSSAEMVYPVNSGITLFEDDADGKRHLVNHVEDYIKTFCKSYDSSEPLLCVLCPFKSEEKCRELLGFAEGFDAEYITSSDHFLWEDPRIYIFELTPQKS